jgi:hypothetical protein
MVTCGKGRLRHSIIFQHCCRLDVGLAKIITTLTIYIEIINKKSSRKLMWLSPVFLDENSTGHVVKGSPC